MLLLVGIIVLGLLGVAGVSLLKGAVALGERTKRSGGDRAVHYSSGGQFMDIPGISDIYAVAW